jgi:hypothetical protein
MLSEAGEAKVCGYGAVQHKGITMKDNDADSILPGCGSSLSRVPLSPSAASGMIGVSSKGIGTAANPDNFKSKQTIKLNYRLEFRNVKLDDNATRDDFAHMLGTINEMRWPGETRQLRNVDRHDGWKKVRLPDSSCISSNSSIVPTRASG